MLQGMATAWLVILYTLASANAPPPNTPPMPATSSPLRRVFSGWGAAKRRAKAARRPPHSLCGQATQPGRFTRPVPKMQRIEELVRPHNRPHLCGVLAYDTNGTSDDTIGSIPDLWRQGGVLIFVHLRRTSGSVLENHYFIPGLVDSLWDSSRNKNTGWWQQKSLNCWEGGLGRFATADASSFSSIRAKVDPARLIYRHCPFGLHEYMPQGRPVKYVTMLRSPGERMISWFHFCRPVRKPNTKGNNDGFCGYKLCVRVGRGGQCVSDGLRQGVNKLGNVSLPTAFYTGREQTLAEMVQRSPFQLQKQFNPERTELLLDDNYATRMICGDKVYEQEAPIGARELECARSRLQHDFSFVGVLERNGESMCALAHLMGVHPDFEFSSNGRRCPSTHLARTTSRLRAGARPQVRGR